MVSPCSFSFFSFSPFRSVPEKSALGWLLNQWLPGVSRYIRFTQCRRGRQNFWLQKSKMPLAGLVYFPKCFHAHLPLKYGI